MASDLSSVKTVKRTVRTHDCGALRATDLGQEIQLCGWIAKRRDHGGLIFADLRDRFGLTQVTFDPAIAEGKAAHDTAGRLRSEFVIWAKGKVRKRPDGMTNPKLATGEIEVLVTDLEILSEAKTPPFAIEDDTDASENLRLKYRYLDLRRPALQRNLLTRAKILGIVRNYLDSNGFCDVETPILYKSTPEGARDFIVPSRMNPGTFYALPQSPQTLKQLLMISGMDRYYQIARCFRDEDLRADRQPEFTQIDIEQSFMDEEAFFPILEGMMKRLWKETLGIEIEAPFPRMPYREAMERFGSDKPDVRFGLELKDLSEIFAKSEFQVFKNAFVKNGRGISGSIRAIVAPGVADQFSRKDLDELTAFVAPYGAKGLLWMKINAPGAEAGEVQSPAAKFFSDAEKAQLKSTLGLKAGDLVLCVSDAKNKVVFDALGALRLKVGEKLGVVPKPADHKYAFLWVVNFPLMEYDDKEGRFFAAHHPFTSPRPEFFDDFIHGRNLDAIEASAYDMVLNGVEVGGGSLRIYRPDVQSAMFKLLGLTPEEAKDKFGFFIEALGYGTPPHGGLAFGVDRLAALICGASAIREVIAFPKTASGADLMADSPCAVTKEQLDELGIFVRQPPSGA